MAVLYTPISGILWFKFKANLKISTISATRGNPILYNENYKSVSKGHSRTVAGVEKNNQGEVLLLLLDPGKHGNRPIDRLKGSTLRMEDYEVVLLQEIGGSVEMSPKERRKSKHMSNSHIYLVKP